MFRRLLVPLDRSAFAEQAIGVAAAIARTANAAIDVALVHQPIPLDAFDDSPLSAGEWSNEREYVASIATEIASGAAVQVTHAVLNGDPVELICRHARYADVDLIVMASHGRTGMRRVWFGSVADGVMRESAIPVLLVRDAPRIAAHHGVASPLYEHILVPLDGSEQAAEVLGPASALAACMGARVTLFRAISSVPIAVPDFTTPFVVLYPDEEATKRSVVIATRELEAMADALRVGGLQVAVEVVVAEGVGEAIVEAARARQVQLIAMTTHGRGASRLIVGSIADSVLETSGLPLLVFRPTAAHLRPGLIPSDHQGADAETSEIDAGHEVAADVEIC